MKTWGPKTTIKYIFQLLAIVGLSTLLYSFLRSAILYQLDNDELSHAHNIYLMHQGLRPYADYFTIYSPIFYWVLSPLFSLMGFTITALFATRVCMFMLFIIRIVFMVAVVRNITNRRIAILFSFLFFLDTFTVFTVLQIRPDNLMMLVYQMDLLCIWFALTKTKSEWWWFAVGFLASCAVLILIKSAVMVGVVGIALLVYITKKKLFQYLPYLFIGGCIPLAAFSAYFATQGTFLPMIQHLFIDAPMSNKTLIQPLPPGNFYWPNTVLFGGAGRPLTFVYVWILPLFASIGVYQSIRTAYGEHRWTPRAWFQCTLGITLMVLWLSLFVINSVFIQYYIPITWLFALFSAITIDDLLVLVRTNKTHYTLISVILSAILAIFIIRTAKANLWRATYTAEQQNIYIQAVWKNIPSNAAVFPNYLFRPLSYPIPYGYYYGDIPPYITQRYGAIETYLQRDHVNYLLLDKAYMQYLPASTITYIEQQYKLVDPYYMLWKHKNTLKKEEVFY